MVIMLIRFILFAILAYVAFIFFRVLLGLKQVSSRHQRPREVQGVMVKDEICGTYIPREDALIEVRGGAEHYFCSEECHRKFLAG
jgi:uncharacterized protein